MCGISEKKRHGPRSIIYFLAALVVSCAAPGLLSLNGFTQWRTGHDEKTVQMIPAGNAGLVREDNVMVVHVKFDVTEYGEISFPINRETPEGTEALKVDLAASKFITLTYQANHEFVLQLRQTGVHGGVQNHVVVPPSKEYTTIAVNFSEFKGGLTPLDLSNVSKFNFAFLGNNPKDGFAELRVKEFLIDGYTP